MKKILLVAAILVAVLAFWAIPKSQAGPAKPIRWKATVAGANLIGFGEFVGGVDHVNINNGSGTNDTACAPSGSTSYSYLELQVFTPSLQFSNMGGFSGVGDPDLAPSGLYGFPKITTAWPDCVGDFLTSALQPTAEYAHIDLRFTTCGCGNTKTDLMAMADGETLPVHMSLLFFTHNWYTLPNSSSTPTQYTFLNLLMNAHGWYSGVTAPFPDIYIKRVGNVWTAYVDTVFDNGAYQGNLLGYNSNDWPVTISDNILGQFATYVPSNAGKKGKTIWTTTYHYPCAKAPLKFQIAFTKY